MAGSGEDCQYCLYAYEDEETGDLLCEMESGFDEDDIARLAVGARARCPMFRPGDEYTIVRKQN